MEEEPPMNFEQKRDKIRHKSHKDMLGHTVHKFKLGVTTLKEALKILQRLADELEKMAILDCEKAMEDEEEEQEEEDSEEY